MTHNSFDSDEKVNLSGESSGRVGLYDIIVTTGFGSGYWPWGPGTAGTALAVVFWCVYAYLLPSYQSTMVLTALLALFAVVIGVPSINRVEKYWGEDPSRVVIDEMAGVWITLLAVPPTKEWYFVLAAFVLFRIMDIWKPLGCRWVDNNIRGGWGVMLDDLLAGVYGGIVLFFIVQAV